MLRYVFRLVLCLVAFIMICGGALAVGKLQIDPNASKNEASKPLNRADSRLEQKVSYEAAYESVEQILSDLSDMTGVKFIAGTQRSDWVVRSRKMNIFVKDVRISDLMESMARVMKFRWHRESSVNPPSYRLLVDSKAAAWADARRADGDHKKEEAWRKRRQDWIDVFKKYGSSSNAELQAFQDTDPILCEYGRRGAVRAIAALLAEVPETQSRFAEGRSFRVSADSLSQQTKETPATSSGSICSE